MNVRHEFLASVGTLCLVVADEDSDGVDRESSEESAALEAPNWGRGGEMIQLLLVSDGTLQSVVVPVALRNSHHAEEAGVSAGLTAAALLPPDAGGEAAQPLEAGGQAALGGGAGVEGRDLVVAVFREDGQSSGEAAPDSRLVQLEVEAGAAH